MDRRQLEYVVAIVDHGGFGRAAHALHVTQSGLSQAVAQAERELGTLLFHRELRPVRPTSAGQAMVDQARAVLRGFGEIQAAVSASMDLQTGEVVAVVLPSLAHWAATPLVSQFRQKYPGISVQLRGPRYPETSELAEMVRRGTSELGLTEAGVSTHGLVEVALGGHDYVAVLPPAAATPVGATITLEEVLSIGLIVGPLWETSRPRQVIYEQLPTLLDESVTVRIDHREAYLPLILGSAGAAILPRFQADFATTSGAIVAELDVAIFRDLVLVHRDGPLTSAAQAFCALATKLCCQ